MATKAGDKGKAPAGGDAALLRTEPAVVQLHGPFDKALSKPAVIKLSPAGGHEHQRLAFKMKSTRPTRFHIRPAFGFIEPGRSKEVKISCKPWDTAKKSTSGKEDRITVVAAVVTADVPASVRSSHLWKHGGPHEPKAGDAVRHVLQIKYVLDGGEPKAADGAKPQPVKEKAAEPPAPAAAPSQSSGSTTESSALQATGTTTGTTGTTEGESGATGTTTGTTTAATTAGTSARTDGDEEGDEESEDSSEEDDEEGEADGDKADAAAAPAAAKAK